MHGETTAAEGRKTKPNSVYLFVIWNRGMPEAETVLGAIGRRFEILRQFEVTWPAKDYIANFAAFYGWKSYSMWLGKKRRSGTGPFRVIVVRDPKPVFTDPEKCGLPELLRNENVHDVKFTLRETMKHSNVVHAAENEAETRHNLKALTGETLEAFLSRSDLDGNAVVPLRFTEPMPYAAYPFADLAEKGPRFFEGWFRPNRVDIFLLPRCGVPTIFSFSFRLFGIFGFAFCLGKTKIWMPRGRR